MRRSLSHFGILLLASIFLAACANTTPQIIMSKKGAVELRAMQSRAFETSNRNKVFRGIIATFQDLGYSIEKVEPAAGTVTADKLARLTMTATVYPRNENRMIVRANAIVKIAPTQAAQGVQVDGAEFYQQRFFEPLSKAIFLQALQVEDADASALEEIAKKQKGDEEARRAAAERVAAAKRKALESSESSEFDNSTQ